MTKEFDLTNYEHLCKQDWANVIVIILGTQAELIKCMPIMKELDKQHYHYIFIHTGQHSLDKACEEFKIRKPDFVLNERSKFLSKINSNSLSWFIKTIFKVKRLLQEIQPDYVLYHGDTMSSAVASIGASKLLNGNKEWKSCHIEAGLRSGSLFEPFPEEISRIICDYFSDTLFTVSDKAKFEGKQVINVGNTIIDSSLMVYGKKKKHLGNYALINLHRHENLNSEGRMRDIVDIIKSIKIKAIFPMHENTRFFLEKYGLLQELEEMKNLEIREIMGYKEFIGLLANCKYVLTDGGSIQEESLVFKKPCLILRDRTERQEGLETGINFLTKLNVTRSRILIEKLEKGFKIPNFDNPYGKQGVSKRIVEVLK